MIKKIELPSVTMTNDTRIIMEYKDWNELRLEVLEVNRKIDATEVLYGSDHPDSVWTMRRDDSDTHQCMMSKPEGIEKPEAKDPEVARLLGNVQHQLDRIVKYYAQEDE